jgi:hypothetical protein
MHESSSLKNIAQLRFILQQPSPCWKDFSIDDIKIKLTTSRQSKEGSNNKNYTLEKILDDLSKKCERTKKTNFEVKYFFLTKTKKKQFIRVRREIDNF